MSDENDPDTTLELKGEWVTQPTIALMKILSGRCQGYIRLSINKEVAALTPEYACLLATKLLALSKPKGP